MKTLRCLIAVALLIVATPVLAANADPASILPQDALVVVRLEKAGAQALLSAVALPPLTKMFAPEMVSPFAYVNELLKLPVGTVERIAPHVTGAAFAVLPNRKNPRRDPNPIFIFSFDNARLATELVAKLPDGKLPDGKLVAIGQHVILCENDNVAAPLVQGDFPKFTASALYQAARKQAAGSLLWAATSVPELLNAIRADMSRRERNEFGAVASVVGLDHMTFALLTVKHVGTAATLEVTVGMNDQPNRSILGLLPTDKIDGAAPAPVDATAKLALNWGDASKFFSGVFKQLRAAFPPDEVGDFDQGVAQVEAVLGVPLDGLFGQLGGGVVAFLLPPDKHGMIGREDWAVVLPLKKSDAFKAVLTNALGMMARGAMLPPPQDLGGLAVQPVPDAPVFYAVTPDAFVVSGSAANVKRAADAKKVPTDAPAILHLNAGRLMAGYPQPVPDTLVLNVALAHTAKQLKLTAKLDGLPEGKALKQMFLPANSLLAAAILPQIKRSRDRARRRARQAASMNNLRQIGTFIEIYRQDHDNQYPPNLKALVDKKYVTALTLFIAPGDKNPPVVNGLKCSYVYIGTPLPVQTPAATIICYTRAGGFRGQRFVLHADYGVSRTWNGHRGALHNPRNRKGDFPIITKLLGPALTEARKKELAKFYGVRVKRVQPVRPPVRQPGGEREFPQPPDR